MKHSNLYLGLVLPSGGWQSLIVMSHTDDSRGVIYNRNMFIVHTTGVAAFVNHFHWFGRTR